MSTLEDGPRIERVERTEGVDPRRQRFDRLERLGASALNDAELLALVLRSGGCGRGQDVDMLAARLLRGATSIGGVAEQTAGSLLDVPGMGRAKVASLLAALELGRRSLRKPLEQGQRIQGPKDVQRHFAARLREWRRESFHVVLLDGRHRVLAVEVVSLGTLTASLVHPREVFREAIRRVAAAMLLVHNHPSGDPSPSQEDRDVTRRLEAAGELLGIRVIDHVIIAEQGYFSFREQDPAFGRPSGNPSSKGPSDPCFLPAESAPRVDFSAPAGFGD